MHSKFHTIINPYQTAAGILLRRVQWDIRPESFRSRKLLKLWKNRFFGKKAVILCNGPSLLKNDLTKLKDVFTFGLNKINLIFDKTDFMPTCIVAVNPLVIEQNADFYNKTEIPIFIDSRSSKIIKSRNNVTFLHYTNIRSFARDCSISIAQAPTVTFVALQLAFHMGFKDVALIGCDHNFTSKGPPNKTVISEEKDENHFDPNYFSGGVKWQLPDLPQSEISFLMAKYAFLEEGRKIYNATEGGMLEIFPRCSLKQFLDLSSS